MKCFSDLISELNEPNLPRISLTPERGKWKTELIETSSNSSSVTSGMTTPSGDPSQLTNQNSETQSLLQSSSSSTPSHNHHISSRKLGSNYILLKIEKSIHN